MPALDEAVEKFVAMRTIEGENLKKDILLKGERIRALVAEVKSVPLWWLWNIRKS